MPRGETPLHTRAGFVVWVIRWAWHPLAAAWHPAPRRWVILRKAPDPSRSRGRAALARSGLQTLALIQQRPRCGAGRYKVAVRRGRRGLLGFTQ